MEESLIKENGDFKIVYSKKNLHFYELACVLIEGDQAVVELHPKFEKQEYYLGISKKEIIDHEKVHFIRRKFKGDKYEEVIAYMTSPSKFRRIFGGIFKNPIESMLFVIFSSILPLIVLLEIKTVFFFGLYVITVFAFLFRLFFTLNTLKKALKNLNLFTNGNGFDALCSLSEKQIDEIAKK